MARRIDAHVTVVHAVADIDAFSARLDDLAPRLRPLVLWLAGGRCWGEPAQGVYLGVDDPEGAFAELRAALGVPTAAAVAYEPHVTLAHPRTVPAPVAIDAWAALQDWTLDERVTLDRLSLIALEGEHWRTLEEWRLNPA
jgi:2'-5' RNA ligase